MIIDINHDQNIQLQRILMNSPWKDVAWIMDKLELTIAEELEAKNTQDELTRAILNANWTGGKASVRKPTDKQVGRPRKG
jgi:hypothetical protein